MALGQLTRIKQTALDQRAPTHHPTVSIFNSSGQYKFNKYSFLACSGGGTSWRCDSGTQHQVRPPRRPTPPTNGSVYQRKYRCQEQLEEPEELKPVPRPSLLLPQLPKRIYQVDDDSRARFGYVAQSNHQVNSTKISAGAGGYTKLPPINTTQQRACPSKDVAEHLPPLKPVHTPPKQR